MGPGLAAGALKLHLCESPRRLPLLNPLLAKCDAHDIACATRYFQMSETVCNVTFQQMFHLLMGGKSCNSFLQRNGFLYVSTYGCFCFRGAVLVNFLITFVKGVLKNH